MGNEKITVECGSSRPWGILLHCHAFPSRSLKSAKALPSTKVIPNVRLTKQKYSWRMFPFVLTELIQVVALRTYPKMPALDLTSDQDIAFVGVIVIEKTTVAIILQEFLFQKRPGDERKIFCFQ